MIQYIIYSSSINTVMLNILFSLDYHYLIELPLIPIFYSYFSKDAAALVLGAPGAPMDVACHDANKDYVIVSWKPPNTASEAPVIGYFVDK